MEASSLAFKSTDRFIREPEVRALSGLSSGEIRRQEADGEFPRRRKIGTRAVAWLESEIAAWMVSRPTTQVRGW